MKHYEECFRKYGDTHRGVDWPNEQDACTRYVVMLQGMALPPFGVNNRVSLLDYGCGLGHFYEFLQSTDIANKIKYTGCDASSDMIKHCKKKFSQKNFFLCGLNGINDSTIVYDYIVCNGVFTEKGDYSFEEMFLYSMQLIRSLFFTCRNGLIINFMSTNVDWHRSDLFHLSIDKLSTFVSIELSRHFVIRNDYALYEYTIYIYKNPFPGIFASSFS